MKTVWAVFMIDLDGKHCLESLWITRFGAESDKIRLSKESEESGWCVTYYIKELELNR